MKKTKKLKAIAYDVYLSGELIDTVWFTGYTATEVKKSLIEHDGYDSNIQVNGQ